MSKLHVEVCRIDKIEPIQGADRIVLATIKGWMCIIGKDQFKEGDLAIYIPPDAVLTEDFIAEQKLSYLKGTRIRTIKLKGTISQGLVLPLTVLPKGTSSLHKMEGSDVAKILGITKYEPPVISPTKPKDTFFNLYGQFIRKEITLRRFVFKSIGLVKDYFRPKKKVNPNFDVYTDIDNVKHYNDVFAEGELVVITEKIHGTNFRAGTLPLNETVIGRVKQFFTKATHEFVYGSHRVQKSAFSGKGFYGVDVYGQIAERYNLKDIIPPDYIVYGEIYGEKIQELTYGLKGIDLVVFDVKYKDKYLDEVAFANFCLERKLPMAPVLYMGEFHGEQLKSFTEGLTTLPMANPHIREGCVVKPLVEGTHPKIGRKILKSISAEYLLTKKQDKPEEFVDDNSEYAH